MNNDNQTMTSHSNGENSINKLIQSLQKEDTRNLTTFNRFQWIFLVFIFFYTFFFIVNPFGGLDLLHRISGVCYVLAFAVFYWVFRKYYREYKAIDYAIPVSEMLQKAARRYSLRNRKSLIIIIPLLLIDAGMSILLYQRYTMVSPWKVIGIIQGIYFPLLIISFLIGVAIWRKRQKPLRDEALRLLNELQNE